MVCSKRLLNGIAFVCLKPGRRSRVWAWTLLGLNVGLLVYRSAVPDCAAAEPTADLSPRVYSLPEVIVAETNAPPLEERSAASPGVMVLRSGLLEGERTGATYSLDRHVGNLNIANSRTRSYLGTYSMRGLSGLEFLGSPAVAMYVDDAPLADGASFKDDWLAVDRIEVFRGPQGSRFGKNAEAGLIRVIPRQPGDRWDAEANARYGSFNTQTYEATAMGPIVSNALSLSLAGRFSRSDGFIWNDFLSAHADRQEAFNGRMALDWRASEDWDFRFTATGDRHRDGLLFTPLGTDPRHVNASLDGLFNDSNNGQVLRVHGALASLDLELITARRDYQMDPFRFDPDFSPLAGNTGLIHRVETQWSEELRLRPREASDLWDWQSGLFFSTSQDSISQSADFFLPQFNLAGRDVLNYQSKSDNYAVFGDLTRRVTERWDLTLGLRLDEFRREYSRGHFSTLGSTPDVRGNMDFFHAAPKLTATHHVSDITTLYASSGLGFRPGGWSPFVNPPAEPRFDSETTWANELGGSTSWWDRKLSAHASFFYNAVYDYQVSEYAPSVSGVGVVNAPRGRTYGAELDLTAQLPGGWEVSGFGGWTDARVNEATDPFTGALARDIRPPFVAAFNGGGSIQYRHSRGWFGRVQFTAVGDTYSDVANTPFLRQAAYGLLGARLGFEGRQFGISVFAENLTDAVYYSRKVAAVNVGASGLPRIFGIMATARH